MKKVVATAIAALYLCVSCPGWSWVVTLGWDGNTENDLDGYRLYQAMSPGGEDYDLPPAQDIEETETTTTVIVGDGLTCWTLTAYDLAQNESGPSNEVCISLPQDDVWPPGDPSGFGIVEVQ